LWSRKTDRADDDPERSSQLPSRTASWCRCVADIESGPAAPADADERFPRTQRRACVPSDISPSSEEERPAVGLPELPRCSTAERALVPNSSPRLCPGIAAQFRSTTGLTRGPPSGASGPRAPCLSRSRPGCNRDVRLHDRSISRAAGHGGSPTSVRKRHLRTRRRERFSAAAAHARRSHRRRAVLGTGLTRSFARPSRADGRLDVVERVVTRGRGSGGAVDPGSRSRSPLRRTSGGCERPASRRGLAGFGQRRGLHDRNLPPGPPQDLAVNGSSSTTSLPWGHRDPEPIADKALAIPCMARHEPVEETPCSPLRTSGRRRAPAPVQRAEPVERDGRSSGAQVVVRPEADRSVARATIGVGPRRLSRRRRSAGRAGSA
jgi:hypothetical protein